MLRASLLPRLLVFALVVCGCSIEIDQTTASTATLPIEQVSGTPSTSTFPATQIPVTWSGLNLRGKLVYASIPLSNDDVSIHIKILDLATGELITLFATEGDGWISYITVAPDGNQLVMSYIAPSQGSGSLNRALYRMPLDGSSPPQLFLEPPTSDDHYIHAEWSPDGQYIYYAHYNSNIRPQGQLDPVYNIFRIKYPDGPPEKIAEPAFWLRISADSARLVYVSIDPVSGENDLVVSNADGSNAQKIAISGSNVPELIDAPIFAPDGQSILYSAPTPTQAYKPSLLDRLMGIQVAKAHDVPSDWWSVPISGGAATRLTRLQTINLFASISPDKKYIASVSGEGIFVMDPDGSNLTQIVLDPAVVGTVNWIP